MIIGYIKLVTVITSKSYAPPTIRKDDYNMLFNYKICKQY